jgi:hypothetical protein
MTFIAAAFMAWYFATPEMVHFAHPALFSNPEWQQLATHLGSPVENITVTRMPRATSPMFEGQRNLSQLSIFRGTALDNWSKRASWSLDSILNGNSLAPIPIFHSVNRCQRSQIDDDAEFQKHWLPYTNHYNPRSQVDFDKVRAVVSDGNTSMCFESQVDVQERLREYFPASFMFSVPGARRELATLHLHTSQVSSPLHYLGGYTMLLQLSGSTQVLASQNLDNLHLFPFSSPLHGQSQVTYPERELEVALPKIANASFRTAKMEPGDVLYVPPYFAFATTALTSGSILEIQSYTSTQLDAMEIVKLPFSEWIGEVSEKSPEKAGFLISLSIDRLRGDIDLPFHLFVQNILEERFATTSLDRNAKVRPCPQFEKVNDPDQRLALLRIHEHLQAMAYPFYKMSYPIQLEIVKDAMERVALASSTDWIGNTLRCWAQQVSSLDIQLDLIIPR